MEVDKSFESFAEGIIRGHEQSVSELLASYHVTKDPSPEVLLAAYIKFGEPFLDSLQDIHNSAPETSNFGAIGNAVKSAGAKLKDSFHTAVHNLSQGKAIPKAQAEDPLPTEPVKPPSEKPKSTINIFGHEVPTLAVWGIGIVLAGLAIWGIKKLLNKQ